ncbi:hypothetical protein SUGI_0360720 [Cryptomeria japonica]|nr:hypothetical protein SUGI_0360720 [Cryptomeria japonica]
MKKSITFSVLAMLWIVSATADDYYGLKVGYYGYACPQAESIVRWTVLEALKRDPTLAPAIIRMHFHDCFVRGCDGSVLIDSTPGNTAEKDSPANNPSLRGFELIDEVKAALESVCPEVVSCADIIAFAARDCSYQAGNIFWDVPAGRRDGRISSNNSIPGNLPPPSFNVKQLTDIFMQKGLSQEEMVVLSGAHSIGVSHCSSFSDRLYNFANTGAGDPTLDTQLAQQLKLICPVTPPPDPIVPMETVSPSTLDNVYYSQLLKNRELFTSDHTLLTNPDTLKVVEISSSYPSIWKTEFAKAMVKMGTTEVLTGSQGEIRKNCRIVN